MKKYFFLFAAVTLTLVSCKKEGCTDPLAENYDEKATADDGSCTYGTGVVGDEITEDITTPTTIAAKTIKICDDISITAAVTVEPGATLIMCAGASITVEDNGSFYAVGTDEDPIMIKGETETKGFWEGIAFKSNNPNNKLIYATVKDAGTYWGWEFANVFVDNNAQLEIFNSTISNSDNVGLYINESGTLSGFTNNTFSNNTTGLNIYPTQVSKLDEASNYNDGNINDWIFVRDGTISVDAIWQPLTTPLLLEGLDLDAQLTLKPGSNLQMEADSYIDVKATGALNCPGNAAEPITIAGRFETPAYWSGIIVRSNNPNNVMTHTSVEDGGSYWGYEYSNIHVEGRLDISSSTIKNANSWGIYVDSGASIYVNGTVETTAGPVEASNTFSNNGTGPDASCTGGCTIFFD